ncbi:MAG: hypothetical protein K2H43_01230 [Clostridia bacterium]|nr:hypothetical protein [Clostridia bacterium]
MAKKKDDWVDDGRTIAPMTGEEIPQASRGLFTGRVRKKNLKNGGKADITPKERRAMIRAMFAVMLPRLLVILMGFSLVFLIMYLWLC